VAATNAAAAQGLGVAFGPLWQVRELVDRGAVEIVLDDFEAARVPIHAVWRPTRTPLAKARLFADLLAARLRRHEL
jgi:DNA-binding transcriptional LysR family regulator